MSDDLPPKVTDAPKTIWLVYGDIERDCTHVDCARHGDVSWCEDKQFDSDVEYVLADRPTGKAPCARHCEAPAFEGEIRTLKRQLAESQAAVAQERMEKLERLVIDAAYTLDKARIWNGMGWTYNLLHPVHYTPMRERLSNECDNIEAVRAAAIRKEK